MFSFSKLADRRWFVRAHHQVEAAESLHGNDPATMDGPRRLQAARRDPQKWPTVWAPQLEVGAAGGAGVRLGVERAVSWDPRTPPARLAHDEPGHGGVSTGRRERSWMIEKRGPQLVQFVKG